MRRGNLLIHKGIPTTSLRTGLGMTRFLVVPQMYCKRRKIYESNGNS